MTISISSQGFKRYFANTSWLMGYRVLNMAVALFVAVYVARYLGPKKFGLLSYAASFVGLFTVLANLGLDNIMVRELVKSLERRDELLGTAFWLKAGGAILMWSAIAIAIPFTHNDTETNILIGDQIKLFLEIDHPSIPEGVDHCVQAGCSEIIFAFMGIALFIL